MRAAIVCAWTAAAGHVPGHLGHAAEVVLDADEVDEPQPARPGRLDDASVGPAALVDGGHAAPGGDGPHRVRRGRGRDRRRCGRRGAGRGGVVPGGAVVVVVGGAVGRRGRAQQPPQALVLVRVAAPPGRLAGDERVDAVGPVEGDPHPSAGADAHREPGGLGALEGAAHLAALREASASSCWSPAGGRRPGPHRPPRPARRRDRRCPGSAPSRRRCGRGTRRPTATARRRGRTRCPRARGRGPTPPPAGRRDQASSAVATKVVPRTFVAHLLLRNIVP